MTHNVLVTGGSGFIAGHIIIKLLEQGHTVRATLRSLDKEAAVRGILAESGMTNGENLSFVVADLMTDTGWPAAVAGVDAVMHVASPVLPGRVDNEDDVIRPAVEGTLRVLRAARDAGVGRVVLTSAFHAVSWGHPHDSHVFTEVDWTVLDGPGVDAYGKAKTLAERAAWDFVADEKLELVTMLPVAVMGPILGKDISGSNHLLQVLMSGSMPGFPDLYIPIVDVRDVAAAHILAMTTGTAAGERFLLSNGPAVAMKQIGATVREHLGARAPKVPTRSIPSIVVRVGALFNPQFRGTVPDLGYQKKTSNEKAKRMLGWQPRPAEEAIAAGAESIAAKGLI